MLSPHFRFSESNDGQLYMANVYTKPFNLLYTKTVLDNIKQLLGVLLALHMSVAKAHIGLDASASPFIGLWLQILYGFCVGFLFEPFVWSFEINVSTSPEKIATNSDYFQIYETNFSYDDLKST